MWGSLLLAPATILVKELTGAGLYLTAQIGITGFVVLFLHEHRHVSAHAAGALLAGINVLAIAARIGSGRISDRLASRLRPLRTIGIALTLFTAGIAAATDAPLAVLVALFLVAGTLSMAWNGLAYASAAEMAGSARTGAALGFQQTLLGVVVAGAPPRRGRRRRAQLAARVRHRRGRPGRRRRDPAPAFRAPGS